MGAALLTREPGLKWHLCFTGDSGNQTLRVQMLRVQPSWGVRDMLCAQQELTCTTEMCPCSTANVSEVQCRLSGWTDGCLRELFGTWKTQQMISVSRVGDRDILPRSVPCKDSEKEPTQFDW